MTNLLKNIISVLPVAQQEAINILIAIKKKNNEITSLRGQEQEAARIYNSIRTKLGKVLFEPRLASPGEKMSSISHNKNMEEIFLDLNSLYENIDQLSRASFIQSITLDSEYQKSKAAVEKLINDATIFALRKKHLDFNEIKYIDFNSTRNVTQLSPKAEVSPRTRLLQAKQLDTTRAHLQNRNSRITKIYTKTKALGIKSGLSKSFPPALMVDQKPETFWSTLVMTDGTVSQSYEKQTRNGVSSQVTVNGPVVEIFFKFSHAERINHIRLLPFSDYPIKIIDVAYRPSINSSVFFSIDDFEESTTLDWEEYNFNSIYAHEVKVTIVQENPKQVIYQLPKSLVQNTDIFQRIYDAKLNKIIGNDLIDSDYALELLRTSDNYENAITMLEEIYKESNLGSPTNSTLEDYYDFNNVISKLLKTIDPDISKESILVNKSQDPGSIQDELVSIRKFEYILGMREVEMGYALYSPTSYYESEKFDVQATVSEVQIEVEERHTKIPTQWDRNHRKTSTEWNIDLGGGRVLPIHPRNIVNEDDGIPFIKDEMISFTSLSGSALTRLGGLYSYVYALKKDGHLIPETDYSVLRQSGAIPKLMITLTGSRWYDPESVYTVDYPVDPTSCKIDVLTRYNSEELQSPDIFTSTGPDNEIYLNKFPFINYEVVNLTGYFSLNPSDNSWGFRPPQANITSGQMQIWPTIIDSVGNILQTGTVSGVTITGLWGERSGEDPLTLQGNPSLSTSYFSSVNGVQFGYFLQLMDSKALYEVSGFISQSGLHLYQAPEIQLTQLQIWDSAEPGIVFSGVLSSEPSGYLNANYTIGIGAKTDDQTFALSESLYSPITVTVGGRAAKNITDYEKFEHPAFSISPNRSTNYEYIQAGKTLYFNQPINGKEIKVSYRWISDYIKLLGVLRCHQKVNPDLSAKVNSILLLINNMVI